PPCETKVRPHPALRPTHGFDGQPGIGTRPKGLAALAPDIRYRLGTWQAVREGIERGLSPCSSHDRRLQRAGRPSLARPPAQGSSSQTGGPRLSLVRPSWVTAGLSCECFLNLVLNYLVFDLTAKNTPQSFAQTDPPASEARLHGRY